MGTNRKPSNEIRTFPLRAVQFRQAQDGTMNFTGHAAVFNEMSEDLGGFREQIDPGAFRKTIREADVRFLVNHDPNMVLARNKAGTLKLREDERGLAVEAEMADTTYARDLSVLLERGDVDQMSFGFYTVKDEWDEASQPPTRTLKEVRLFDVSVVTYPAYPGTDAGLRDVKALIEQLAELEPHHFAESFVELRKSDHLSSETMEKVNEAINHLKTFRDSYGPGRTLSLAEIEHRAKRAEVLMKYGLTAK